LIVLGGGGAAAWFVLRKEDDPNENKETEERPETGDTSLLGGRNVPDQVVQSEVLKKLLAQAGTGGTTTTSPAPTVPKPEPVLASSDEGKMLIEERARLLQQTEVLSDSIRVNNRVGRTLLDSATFDYNTQTAIKQMFSTFTNQGVDPENYRTYPIYGRWETNGTRLRSELQNYLDKGWRAFNLTQNGNRNDCFISSLSLNLLLGDRDSHIPSADKIWWAAGINQSRLDWYKKMNGHDVSNQSLLEIKHGKPTYAAGYMYTFVQKWVAEIDYFDRVTVDEAKQQLINDGLIINVEDKTQKIRGGTA
jgi:hypothetical protein